MAKEYIVGEIIVNDINFIEEFIVEDVVITSGLLSSSIFEEQKMFLRQSTAQAVKFGPALDKTDGVTEETGLTLTQADMRLSKSGGAFAQKSASGNATHDSDGYYGTTLSTTDTNTVGKLRLNIHQPANMLPIWEDFYVIEEAVFDLLFAAGATGKPTLAAVTHTGATIPTVSVNTDMRGTDSANTTTPPTVVQNRQEMDSNSSQLAAIKVPTDKLVFTVANKLDVNVKNVNDQEISGDGSSGTEFQGAP